MRVTNSVIAGNVSFNTQRAISRFLELQIEMSSWRRISKSSDDPIGTIRDLNYRKELSKIQRYRGTIAQAQNWLGIYDNDLVKLVAQLANYENNYQAALMASARNIQPTLLDFLR